MLRRSQPAGDYLTRAAAAYPSELNQELARVFQKAVSSMKALTVAASMEDTNKTGQLNNVVTLGLPLRGQQTLGYKVDDDKYSLRNIHSSVSDRALNIGKQIANLIVRKLSQGNVEETIISNIGRPMEDVKLPLDWLDELRSEVANVLVRNRSEAMTSSCDVEAIDTQTYQTSTRGHLLEYWARAVEDPGMELAKWTYQGAPAGIECQTLELDGVCPRVDETEQQASVDLSTHYDTFENYEGVEDDSEAAVAIDQYLSKGYLMKFDTLEELQHS